MGQYAPLDATEPGFAADDLAASYLATKGAGEIVRQAEPTPTRFDGLLAGIQGKTVIVTFDDLDEAPRCIDALAEQVKKTDPGGRLVVDRAAEPRTKS
jgi:class 3 adenylate cyclase